MGGRTARVRDMQMASLLDQGFATLNRGQPPPAQPATGTTLVATSGAAAPAAGAAAAAVVPPRPAAAAPVAAAAATTERTPTAEPKRDLISAALRHLAPVSRAEAAPVAHQPREADEWAIQIGAFRAPAAAAHAAREVAQLAIARGKPRQILAPVRAERQRLYRARLLHFTERGAQTACAELRRRGFACTVLRPDALRFARS
jgi:D-alanyl-D-alanine carboxypeptidase (penicillin-binding protein 5/6)